MEAPVSSHLPGSLPVPRTRLIGREGDLADQVLDESEALFAHLQDALGLTHVANYRGLLAQRRGDPERAEPLVDVGHGMGHPGCLHGKRNRGALYLVVSFRRSGRR